MEQTQKQTHDLSAEETALFREYDTALVAIDRRELELKRELENVAKARDEARFNANGTLRVLMRQHQLDGSWAPSEDFTQLIRRN